jgi:hypothetical protein
MGWAELSRRAVHTSELPDYEMRFFFKYRFLENRSLLIIGSLRINIAAHGAPVWSSGQSSWLADPEVPGSIPRATRISEK